MLTETVTRLEMSWKKLLRAEKGAEADREKSSEKGTRRDRTGENEMAEEQGRKEARGWLPMSSAEKRQSLKHATTYQAVNGIAMPRLFFTWVDFTTRDITLPFQIGRAHV